MSRTHRIAASALAVCALSPATALAQDLRTPDSVPQPAPRQDLRSPDSIVPPAPTQDLRAPDAVDGRRSPGPVIATPIAVEAPGGIDWGDAALGAGIGAILVLTLSGGAVTITRQRRRHVTPA
jgi:hypothetical protein